MFPSCIAERRIGLFWDHIKKLVFPTILWLNSFKWAPSLRAAAQVPAVSIVYRSPERRDGSQRKAGRGITSVREKERQSDMGKLDPERKMAGGKVAGFSAQAAGATALFWLTPEPQACTRAHTATFMHAKSSQAHSRSDKHTQACKATHKCHEHTLRLWVEFILCHPRFLPLYLVRQQTLENCVNWIMLMCSQACVQVAEQLTNSYKYFHQQHHLVQPNYRACYALGQACRYRKTNIWFGKYGKSIKGLYVLTCSDCV